nr:aminoacyl-tRNA synthetase, class 1a, anticodon-binding [Tanacetum cinerariifolium]
SGGDVFDLIGDVALTDEDGDTGMDDSTGVSASLGGEISPGGRKSRELNSDNTGGITIGEAIGACSRGIEMSPPPPSPVVAPHPLPDPMPSPPRKSSPPPIPFGPTPSSGVVFTEPIPDIPYSSEPSEPVLENITSPDRDDDTGGGSFHESPPHPPPATPPRSLIVGVVEEPLTLTSLLALFPTCLQRIATLEAELKATRILHRDTVVLFAKRIKKLESKLKSKKRKLVLSDSENKEEARQTVFRTGIRPTTLDAVLILSQSKARARVATIIYKRLKKQRSSSGLDFTNAAIPAGGLDSAGGVDSAGGLVSAGGLDSAGGLPSAGILVAAGPTVPAEPSSPIRDPSKGKAVATPSSPELKQSLDAEQVYLDSLLAQRVAEEQERESMASAARSAQRQAGLDRVALNLTNEEWIGLVDQVRANPTLSAELLGADVSEDIFSIRMVELMNRRRKMIAKMKAKAKREKPMTLAQQKEFIRTFIRRAGDLATAKDHHQHLKRSGETLESTESKKLKISHNTTQLAELQETTSVSTGTTVFAGDPIPAVTSVSAASFISAVTPNTAGVSTTAGASGSTSEASVPIIELLDSPPNNTSLPLDLELEAQDATLRKSLRKKSIARRRTLSSAYKPTSDALPFDEDDPEAEFKRYLRQASDDDEPAEPVSLALRFSTLRELMYWAGRADLMVLYGLVLDKYKAERATGIGLCLWSDLRILITSREERDVSIIWDDQDQWQIRSWRFYALPAIHVLETKAGDIMYMFVDKKYPLTLETIQRMLNHGLEIDRDPSDLLNVCRELTMPAWVLNCLAFKLEEIDMAMMTCLKSSGVHYQRFTKLDNKQVTIQFRGGLLGIVIPAARYSVSAGKSSFLLVTYFCWQYFITPNQESLPEDIMGVTTLRHTGSHYLKMYWESLPEDVLGVITRRRTGSHYPKTYWESLPEDVLGVIARRLLGQMTYLVASLTLDSANSYVIQGASCTQRKVSMVLFSTPFVLYWGGSNCVLLLAPSTSGLW